MGKKNRSKCKQMMGAYKKDKWRRVAGGREGIQRDTLCPYTYVIFGVDGCSVIDQQLRGDGVPKARGVVQQRVFSLVCV